MASRNSKDKTDRTVTGRKSNPGPRGGREEARERVAKYASTMDSTKLAIKKNGLLRKEQGHFNAALGGQLGTAVDRDDARKINSYLRDNDYSLTPGEGRAVVGYKKITVQPQRNFALMNKGAGYAGPGDEMLAIYGGVGKERNRNRGDRGGQGGSRGGKTGGGEGGAEGRQIAAAGAQAEDRLYGRTPEGLKPAMFPAGQSIEGRAPEAIADYTDRLDRYNQNMIGWMNDRAVASQYEMGSFLDRFAAGLPPAPDVMSPAELLKISQSGARTNFG